MIPLAGRGKRFVEEGYDIPKPLITIDGVPMVVKAAQALPESDTPVFLCQKEHIDRYQIDGVIRKYYQKAHIVPVEKLTEGQASTCLLGEPFVDPDAILTIGACDNAVMWNKDRFEELISSSNVDALIWTFRNNPIIVAYPQMYGWIPIDQHNYAKKVSVKIPISEDPIRDHAIVGTFTFKKALYFFDYAKRMVKENRRINREFYIDECMNLLIEDGLKVKVFEVDTFICWGTPDDLKIYEYWKDYFQKIKR